MDRWVRKVAVVTGASSGLGAAISKGLVAHGVKVVGLARRLNNMEKIAMELKSGPGSFHPIQCDLTKEKDILDAFQFADTLGSADILVNNAGLAFPEYIIDGKTEHLTNMLDVNLLAAAICTREAVKSMRHRNSTGHIINMSSILGQNVTRSNAPLLLYQTTKCALSAMSEVVRNEICMAKAQIKVTNLAPGLVRTQMPIIEASGGDKIFEVLPHLKTEDVVNAVLYTLATPPQVQVTDLTITALHECSLNLLPP